MIQFVSKLYAVMVIYCSTGKTTGSIVTESAGSTTSGCKSPALHQNSQPWHLAYNKIRYANHQIRFWTLTFGHNPKV